MVASLKIGVAEDEFDAVVGRGVSYVAHHVIGDLAVDDLTQQALPDVHGGDLLVEHVVLIVMDRGNAFLRMVQ